MIRSAHYATTADRQRNISVITGLVQKHFGSAQALMVELENSLRRARFEASRYEFKLGLCELGVKPSVDAGMFTKIARTACAIANTNPRHDGYMYIGVADKESAANRVQQLFRVQPIKIGDFYFVGLAHDLTIMGINLETYLRRLILEISKLPLSEPLKTQLTTSIDHGEYQGRPFVRLRVPGQSDLSSYDGAYPVRKNSETVDMGPAEVLAQSRLFLGT
jgi:predicted HTH transcriptional regulator